MAGEGVEIGVDVADIGWLMGNPLCAVDYDLRSDRVRHLRDALDVVDRPERIAEMIDRDEFYVCGDSIDCNSSSSNSPSSFMGMTAKLRAGCSQAICQGTMLLWCSIAETRTSSSAFSRERNDCGDEIDRFGRAAGEDDLA